MKTPEEILKESARRNGNPEWNEDRYPMLHKEVIEAIEAYHAQYEEKFEAKRQSLEMELCECGHTVPMGFIHYDANSCGTCINCMNDELIFRLGKKNKQIKKLKDKINKIKRV